MPSPRSTLQRLSSDRQGKMFQRKEATADRTSIIETVVDELFISRIIILRPTVKIVTLIWSRRLEHLCRARNFHLH